MKEFLKSLKYVIIFQIISWGIFILVDESPFIIKSSAEMISIWIVIFLLIVLLLLYFIFSKKVIAKNNYNSIIFNASLLILWIIFSILGIYITLKLVDIGVLHYCSGGGWNCFLNGIEYTLFGFGLLIIVGIIILWKIIYYCYKSIRNYLDR